VFSGGTNKTSITVQLPDRSQMSSTHEGYLRLPYLSKAARKVHFFLGMHASLVWVGQLCNDGCITTFNRNTIVVRYENHIVLKGHRTNPQVCGMYRYQQQQHLQTQPRSCQVPTSYNTPRSRQLPQKRNGNALHFSTHTLALKLYPRSATLSMHGTTRPGPTYNQQNCANI
jgi:hypothetical protein